ncbi:type II toxin-antitoxin system Phd/YefM family antitoxin [Candidatus Poriferisodalis sp.]|uniref:type II toxin-antitoxin system Phd/YefM family antitoxin n=1 Tax=Candidatus Poriferisodalis sp. TaxID=3101277 RepID=UPI003B01544F
MEAGIRELRNHLSKYLVAARAGQEIVVTDHGKVSGDRQLTDAAAREGLMTARTR